MGFRDQELSREAKVDALTTEQESQDARIEALERRLSAAEEELETLKKGGVKAKAARSTNSGSKDEDAVDAFARRWRAVFITAGAALLVCGYGMYSAMRRGAEGSDSAPREERPVETPPARVPDPIENSQDIVDMIERAAAEGSARLDGDSFAELFAGIAVEAEGHPEVSPRTRCVVAADSLARLRTLQAPTTLRVRCGSVTVYEQNAASAMRCRIAAQTEENGGAYTFQCDDRGIRDELPELSLRSVDRTLRVWSEVENWSLRIELERAVALVGVAPFSARQSGLPLREPVTREYRVIERLGDGAPERNVTVRLDIAPEDWASTNCSVDVSAADANLGRLHARCSLDAELNVDGIEAPMEPPDARSEGLSIGLTQERGSPNVVVNGAEPTRSWRLLLEPL
ncbi:MAG: hypothetical protein AAF411_11560 [Myxococcota bacterium]